MTRWLVTVDADTDLGSLQAKLRKLGCEQPETGSAIPLEPDQLAVPVEGPADLPARAARSRTIRAVYPASDIELL